MRIQRTLLTHFAHGTSAGNQKWAYLPSAILLQKGLSGLSRVRRLEADPDYHKCPRALGRREHVHSSRGKPGALCPWLFSLFLCRTWSLTISFHRCTYFCSMLPSLVHKRVARCEDACRKLPTAPTAARDGSGRTVPVLRDAFLRIRRG